MYCFGFEQFEKLCIITFYTVVIGATTYYGLWIAEQAGSGRFCCSGLGEPIIGGFMWCDRNYWAVCVGVNVQ